MSRHQRNGVRQARTSERRKIRRATAAVLDGARSRVSHIGPNWRSGKFKREVPDNETSDRD